MEIKITIESGKNLAAAFRQFPELVAPYLRDASTKSAFVVEGKAKKLSPVDTGRMRASIGTSLGVRDKGITAIVQTNVFYAIYVHEGTKRMRGRPFMRQAAETSTQEIQRYYQQAAQLAMQKVKSVAQ